MEKVVSRPQFLLRFVFFNITIILGWWWNKPFGGAGRGLCWIWLEIAENCWKWLKMAFYSMTFFFLFSFLISLCFSFFLSVFLLRIFRDLIYLCFVLFFLSYFFSHKILLYSLLYDIIFEIFRKYVPVYICLFYSSLKDKKGFGTKELPRLV